MRILHILLFPLYGSGSGTFVRNIIQETEKLGHKVALCCPEKHNYPNFNIYRVRLPFNAAYTGHPSYRSCKKYCQLTGSELWRICHAFEHTLLKAVADFKPDLIHVHHISHLLWITKFTSIFYQIPYIVTSHNTDLLCLETNPKIRELVNDGIREAYHITVPSAFSLKKFLDIYQNQPKFQKLLRQKSSVIYGGTNLEQKHNIFDLDTLYTLNNQPVILYSGKITQVKGLEYLVKAAPKIRGIIVILGDGKIRKTLKEYVTKNKIQNVMFRGHLGAYDGEELQAWYQRATIAIQPTIIDEGLGLSILEAMAYKTPIVATRSGGMVEVVKENNTGCFIKQKDINSIIKVVNKLLEQPEKMKEMGKNAQKIVKDRFTWPAITKQFFKLYIDMIPNIS